MFKKTITYEDYDGNKRTEDHYFNLNKAELYELLTTDSGYTLDKRMEQMMKKGNAKELISTFKMLISKSYGEKSLDGRQFVKSDEITRSFMQTEAYSIFFTELISNAKNAAEFFNGIIPKDLSDEIAKIIKDNPDGIPDDVKEYLLDSQKNP